MIARHTFLLTALIVSAAVTTAQNKPTPANPSQRRELTSPGKHTYLQYCASCHGAEARGNGPAAFVLKTIPPDLTTLASRHGGKFPHEYVFDVMRFGTRFASHGSSDMPIWGPVFGSLENYDELAVRKRIRDLSDYLESLQQKES